MRLLQCGASVTPFGRSHRPDVLRENDTGESFAADLIHKPACLAHQFEELFHLIITEKKFILPVRMFVDVIHRAFVRPIALRPLFRLSAVLREHFHLANYPAPYWDVRRLCRRFL